MKTYILEGTVTALTSICHNGGERNGVVTQLRREKIVQPNRKTIEVPVISGNSIRGKLRDIAAQEILTKEDGIKIKVDADSFNLLFSGGSLESTGSAELNIEKVRKLRMDIPILSVLGCSVGNIILPGKVDINKLIPVAKETAHIIPEKYHGTEPLKSVWEYCQVEMYTRTDDAKNENYREYLSDEAKAGEKIKSQMMYHTETIAAGTVFYWKICLRDTTDEETGAFLQVLQKWSDLASQLGGNGRVGHGAIRIDMSETSVIDSELKFDNPKFVKYIDTFNAKRKDVSEYFEKGVSKTLFG